LNLREIGKITVLNLRGNEKHLISAAEIAFGIMAEILLVKNNGSLTHRKNK
jgi:hypothetical protein